MAASEIKAGKAYVELTMRDRFTKSLGNAEKRLKSFGTSIATLGASAVGLGVSFATPFIAAAKVFADMGDELTKASERTGVAVEALSGLKYAAEQSGVSFEELESGIRKMQLSIVDAAGGSKEATAKLAALGLTVGALIGMSPDQQFLKIADAINKIQDPAKRVDAAVGLMGKSAATLLPLLKGGAAAIGELTDRAKQLGLVIDKDAADAATEFGDVMADLWKQIKMVIFYVGLAVAEVRKLEPAMTKAMSRAIEFTKNNKLLIQGLAAGAVAVIAFGVALVTAGGLIAATGAIVGATMTVISTAVAAVASPIGAVAAVTLGLVGTFLAVTDSGRQMVTDLVTVFGELSSIATQTFGGIADALAGGEIELAAEILWTGLQAIWATGVGALQSKWIDFKSLFLRTAAAAFYGAQDYLNNALAGMYTAWADFEAFVGDLWDGFIGTFTSLWDSAVGKIANGLNWIRSLWDDTFDADAAAAAGDAIVNANEKTRRAAEMSRQKEREDERALRQQAIEARRQRESAELGKKEAKFAGETLKGSDAEQRALEEKKRDLKLRLDSLNTQASDANFFRKPAAVKEREKQQEEAKAQIKTTVSSAGTFNPAAVQGLQTSALSYHRRTADGIEALLREVKRGGGLKFGP